MKEIDGVPVTGIPDGSRTVQTPYKPCNDKHDIIIRKTVALVQCTIDIHVVQYLHLAI